MTDKKEIAELSVKVSVDTTDLDKLEAQLRRINGLMVSIGLKKPASGGFVTHYINIDNGQAYFNGASLKSACITRALKKEPEETERLKDGRGSLVTSSLAETLQQVIDGTQKNQQQIEELTLAFNDANAAIADKFRQVSIDALRNNSGFA
ncbi:hypothetical protein HMPREF1562_2357 [Providencia alcalifaciens F90-2004]|uniref:hypothetical protein n=1 Tax=Providencia alcalifaciens TaxID=126385 RepID=UPI0004463AB2|nr:hypothetical protein [Providencia alcalifaciens]ETT08697.1 hypothetical protein HMPREF1562_2357 [Providencia alcalifaciens F90-2004]